MGKLQNNIIKHNLHHESEFHLSLINPKGVYIIFSDYVFQRRIICFSSVTTMHQLALFELKCFELIQN